MSMQKKEKNWQSWLDKFERIGTKENKEIDRAICQDLFEKLIPFLENNVPITNFQYRVSRLLRENTTTSIADSPCLSLLKNFDENSDKRLQIRSYLYYRFSAYYIKKIKLHDIYDFSRSILSEGIDSNLRTAHGCLLQARQDIILSEEIQKTSSISPTKVSEISLQSIQLTEGSEENIEDWLFSAINFETYSSDIVKASLVQLELCLETRFLLHYFFSILTRAKDNNVSLDEENIQSALKIVESWRICGFYRTAYILYGKIRNFCFHTFNNTSAGTRISQLFDEKKGQFSLSDPKNFINKFDLLSCYSYFLNYKRWEQLQTWRKSLFFELKQLTSTKIKLENTSVKLSSSDEFETWQIQQSYQFCTFIRELFNDCILSLGKKPSCLYSIVLLGSAARGESTAYSDIEYYILFDWKKDVEISCHQQEMATRYFVTLAELFEDRVKSLGESDILNLGYPKNLHVDEQIHPLLQDKGKLPGSSFDSPFITTPINLVKNFFNDKIENIGQFPEPWALLNSQHLLGDETVYETFISELQNRLKEHYESWNKSVREVCGLSYLKKHANGYHKVLSSSPELLTAETNVEDGMFNLKANSIEPLKFFVGDLALYYGLLPRKFSWVSPENQSSSQLSAKTELINLKTPVEWKPWNTTTLLRQLTQQYCLYPGISRVWREAFSQLQRLRHLLHHHLRQQQDILPKTKQEWKGQLDVTEKEIDFWRIEIAWISRCVIEPIYRKLLSTLVPKMESLKKWQILQTLYQENVNTRLAWCRHPKKYLAFDQYRKTMTALITALAEHYKIQTSSLQNQIKIIQTLKHLPLGYAKLFQENWETIEAEEKNLTEKFPQRKEVPSSQSLPLEARKKALFLPLLRLTAWIVFQNRLDLSQLLHQLSWRSTLEVLTQPVSNDKKIGDLQGINLGTRQWAAEIKMQLWDMKGQFRSPQEASKKAFDIQSSEHLVIPLCYCGEVLAFAKIKRRLPGMDIAMEVLQQLWLTHAVAHHELIRAISPTGEILPILLAQAMPGKTLKTVLEISPEQLQQLDEDDYMEHVLLAFWTNPGDGWPRNWKVVPLPFISEQKLRYRLVNIDANHTFVLPFIKVGLQDIRRNQRDARKLWQLKLQVLTILYCLSLFSRLSLSSVLQERLILMDPWLLLNHWLLLLREQEIKINKLFKDVLPRFYQQEKEDPLFPLIRLPQNIISNSVQTFYRLRHYCFYAQAVKLNEVLDVVHTSLASYYKRATQTSFHPSQCLTQLAGSQYVSQTSGGVLRAQFGTLPTEGEMFAQEKYTIEIASNKLIVLYQHLENTQRALTLLYSGHRQEFFALLDILKEACVNELMFDRIISDKQKHDVLKSLVGIPITSLLIPHFQGIDKILPALLKAGSLKNLLVLDVSECEGLTEELLSTIATQCSRLEKLVLKGARECRFEQGFLERQGFAKQRILWKSLQRLTIEDYTYLSRFIEITEIPQLVQLTLRNIVSWEWLKIPEGQAKLKNLRRLAIKDCASLTDNELEKLTENLGGLKRLARMEGLRLSRCSSVNDAYWREICPLLIGLRDPIVSRIGETLGKVLNRGKQIYIQLPQEKRRDVANAIRIEIAKTAAIRELLNITKEHQSIIEFALTVLQKCVRQLGMGRIVSSEINARFNDESLKWYRAIMGHLFFSKQDRMEENSQFVSNLTSIFRTPKKKEIAEQQYNEVYKQFLEIVALFERNVQYLVEIPFVLKELEKLPSTSEKLELEKQWQSMKVKVIESVETNLSLILKNLDILENELTYLQAKNLLKRFLQEDITAELVIKQLLKLFYNQKNESITAMLIEIFVNYAHQRNTETIQNQALNILIDRHQVENNRYKATRILDTCAANKLVSGSVVLKLLAFLTDKKEEDYLHRRGVAVILGICGLNGVKTRLIIKELMTVLSDDKEESTVRTVVAGVLGEFAKVGIKERHIIESLLYPLHSKEEDLYVGVMAGLALCLESPSLEARLSLIIPVKDDQRVEDTNKSISSKLLSPKMNKKINMNTFKDLESCDFSSKCDYSFKITLLGSAVSNLGCGKTHVLGRYINHSFIVGGQFIKGGASFNKKVSVYGRTSELQMENVSAGAPGRLSASLSGFSFRLPDQYRAVMYHYLSEAQILILFFEVTSLIDNVKFEMQHHLRDISKYCNFWIPILLVATKIDLQTRRRISFSEGEELAKEIGAVEYLECSAKTGEGINEIFFQAARYACCNVPDKDILENVLEEFQESTVISRFQYQTISSNYWNKLSKHLEEIKPDIMDLSDYNLASITPKEWKLFMQALQSSHSTGRRTTQFVINDTVSKEVKFQLDDILENNIYCVQINNNLPDYYNNVIPGLKGLRSIIARLFWRYPEKYFYTEQQIFSLAQKYKKDVELTKNQIKENILEQKNLGLCLKSELEEDSKLVENRNSLLDIGENSEITVLKSSRSSTAIVEGVVTETPSLKERCFRFFWQEGKRNLLDISHDKSSEKFASLGEIQEEYTAYLGNMNST